MNKELDESKSTRVKYVEQKFYYDILSTILNDTGIKTRIIRKYLPVINKHVNNYLKDMDFLHYCLVQQPFHLEQNGIL